MIKKLLVVIIVIVLLFGVCAMLESETSPDGTATGTKALWQMTVNSVTESLGQIKDGIVGIFKSVTKNEKSSNEDVEIGEISADQLPKEAKEYYERYCNDGWETTSDDLEGKTQAGDPYENRSKVLPQKDTEGEIISYREFDAETTLKGGRGKKRFVHGSNGLTYYTDDHYETFKKVTN